MNKDGMPPWEKIEKLKVPDDDVPDWMQTLHESGFSSDEIDAMMRHLNDEYATQKLRNIIEQEVEAIDRMLQTKRGAKMSAREREVAKNFVLDRLRDVDPKKLESGKRKHN